MKLAWFNILAAFTMFLFMKTATTEFSLLLYFSCGIANLYFAAINAYRPTNQPN